MPAQLASEIPFLASPKSSSVLTEEDAAMNRKPGLW